MDRRMDRQRVRHLSTLLRTLAGQRRAIRHRWKRGEIEQGISAGEPGTKPPYRISGHLFFESTEAMEDSLFRHMPELLADIPNYTNIQPTVQISEVLL